MNRHPKRRRDPNQFAKSIIDVATGQGPAAPPDNQDPAAVARGRMGGLEGGKARPDKLSADERAAVAKAGAAASCWLKPVTPAPPIWSFVSRRTRQGESG